MRCVSNRVHVHCICNMFPYIRAAGWTRLAATAATYFASVRSIHPLLTTQLAPTRFKSRSTVFFCISWRRIGKRCRTKTYFVTHRALVSETAAENERQFYFYFYFLSRRLTRRQRCTSTCAASAALAFTALQDQGATPQHDGIPDATYFTSVGAVRVDLHTLGDCFCPRRVTANEAVDDQKNVHPSADDPKSEWGVA